MEKKAARFISFILHPLIIPTAGLLILFSSGTYVSLMTLEAKKVLLLITGTGTFLFPVTLMPFLFHRKLISDLSISAREERFLPMVFIFLLFLFTFFLIYKLPVNRLIHGYFLSITIALLLTILANSILKISTHMVGIGSLAGLIISLVMMFGLYIQPLFIIVIIAAGLCGYSRLKLGEHTEREVYLGFMLGFAVVLSVMLIYAK